MSKRDLSLQARAILLLLAEEGSLRRFDLTNLMTMELNMTRWRVHSCISNLLANGLLNEAPDESVGPNEYPPPVLSLTEAGKARINPYTHA